LIGDWILLIYPAVPLIAAGFGIVAAFRQPNWQARRIAAVLLAMLGVANLAMTCIRWDRYCWETWQPCGPALGRVAGVTWILLAAVLLGLATYACVAYFRGRLNR
jgi:hypothetical protein